MAASKNPYVVLCLTSLVIMTIFFMLALLLRRTLNCQLVAETLFNLLHGLFGLPSNETLFYENYFVLFGWFGLVFNPKKKHMRNLLAISAVPVCYNYAKIFIFEASSTSGFSLVDLFSMKGWFKTLAYPWFQLAAACHIYLADLVVGYYLQSQFHERYNIADVWYGKVIIAVILLATWFSAPLGILCFICCPLVISAKYERQPNGQKKERQLHPNSRPVHFGETLPHPLRDIFYIVKAIAGTVVLVFHLFAYLLLVIGCLFYYFIYPTVRPPYIHPPSSNKRYWLRETPPSALIPPFIRNSTAQMRADLLSFDPSERGIIWFMAHHLLLFAAMVEIGLNQQTNGGLAAALYQQFGPVFPWADGVGVGDKDTMMQLMQDKREHKGPNSVSGPVSDSQREFCHISTITLSNVPPEGPLMFNAREVLITWIKNFAHRRASETTDTPEWKSLTASFPRVLNHKLPDPNEIYLVFGQTLFFMINGGRFTTKENAAFLDLTNNLLPFFPSWFNFLALGGYLERKANKSYYIMMRAMFREKGKAYKMAIAKAKELNTVKYDSDRAEDEALRLISSVMAIAGAPAPTKLTYAILQRLYSDPSALELYKKYGKEGDETKMNNFIKECARLDPGVFWVNMIAHDKLPLYLGDERVVQGTPVHCYVPFGSLDPDVFHDPMKFDPERTNLDQILSWNGLEKWVAAHDGNNAPRYCPGHDISIEAMKLIVDHYLDDLGSNGNEDRAVRVMDHFDAFTQSVVQISNARVENWQKKTYADMVIKNDSTIDGYYHPFTLPMNEEDDPGLRTYIYDLAGLFATYVPVTDDNFEFTDADLIAFRKKCLPTFPSTHAKLENEEFYRSDEVVKMLAFFGLGCHRTRKLTSYAPVDERAKDANNIPEKAVYINDNTLLYAYPVRASYERYGAAAYFDNDFKLIGIYVCYKQQLYRPTAPDAPMEEVKLWQAAKWVWKTSMFTLVTLQDHLCMSHLIESTTLVKNYRNLRPDGTLRVFLKPFTINTVYINKLAGDTLYGTNGLAARVWAFEDSTLVLEDLKHSYRYSDDFVPTEMNDLDDKDYPIKTDYAAFKANIRWYVEQLAVILQQSETGREEMEQFTRGICSDLNLIQPTEYERNTTTPTAIKTAKIVSGACPYSAIQKQVTNGDQAACVVPTNDNVVVMVMTDDHRDINACVETPLKSLLPSSVSSSATLNPSSECRYQQFDSSSQMESTSQVKEQIAHCPVKDTNVIETFIEVTTHLILNGSAVHEFVGEIAEYHVSPSFVGCRIVDGYSKDSAQAYALNTSLTTSTGIQQPKILDGFKSFFKDMHDLVAKKQLIKSYKVFQNMMGELSKTIDCRNRYTRKYPFWFMNPSSTSSSVCK